jgi:uncharacterized integral membrane protein
MVGPERLNERSFVMKHPDGWMNRWLGGGMWAWTMVGILLVILLAVLIGRATRK